MEVSIHRAGLALCIDLTYRTLSVVGVEGEL